MADQARALAGAGAGGGEGFIQHPPASPGEGLGHLRLSLLSLLTKNRAPKGYKALERRDLRPGALRGGVLFSAAADRSA